MNDLIWIGNTLYPRWFVMAVPLALVITPYVIAAVVSGLRRKREGCTVYHGDELAEGWDRDAYDKSRENCP